MRKYFLFFPNLPMCWMLIWLQCSPKNPTNSSDLYPEAAAQNIDVEQLIQAFDQLASVPGIKSMLLGRGGVIAAEKYVNGGGADIIHDVRSCTKSVIALLVGIAMREGFIQSVDQTIGEFLEGTVVNEIDPTKAAITIDEVLKMSCGLEWHELDGGNSYGPWVTSTNPVGWVLDQEFIHPSGQGFNYNTGSSHLLSVILTLTSGMSTLEFAQTYLFEPLGILESDWTVLQDGNNNGGAGCRISPHAMFSIGTLILNDGLWNGIQVVPEDWVINCVTNHNVTNHAIPYGTHYGYKWWLGLVHGYSFQMAMGWGGQYIVCVPDLDLVVCATCEWIGVSANEAGEHWFDIITTIMEDIIPAVNE